MPQELGIQGGSTAKVLGDTSKCLHSYFLFTLITFLLLISHATVYCIFDEHKHNTVVPMICAVFINLDNDKVA